MTANIIPIIKPKIKRITNLRCRIERTENIHSKAGNTVLVKIIFRPQMSQQRSIDL